ncbi:MAG: ribonuclease P protein component [Acidimicrobiia bacterium]|nr:ribonuclease P protein component [Acidimicrobiia bacterium]
MRSRRTFSALREHGSRARSGPVSVTFVQVEGSTGPAVAYAVGRRVGGAVVRNRLRRRLRACVAEVAPSLEPGAYLVAAGAGAAVLPPGQLQTAVAAALRRSATPTRKPR